MGGIILGSVGRHLHRAVDDDIEGKFLGESRAHAGERIDGIVVIERSESIIHRACQTAGEGHQDGVFGRITAVGIPSTVFLTAHALLCHKVWPCAL